MAKLKPFSGIVRQNIQIYLNQNLVIRRFLENGFEGIVSSKTNVFSVKKRRFSVFCKFLSDEVETVFLGKQGNAAKSLCLKSALFGAF